MRRVAVCLLPALVLGCVAAEPGVETSAQAIINGAACGVDVEPTSVAILAEGRVILPANLGELPIKTVICTGTLIAPDVVLTAAHCVDPGALSQGIGEVMDLRFFVTVEPNLGDLASGMATEFPANAMPATAAMRHESFDIQSLTQVNGPGEFFDVGLLFLETPVEDVDPEVVITQAEAVELVVGADVTIAGWGQQTPESGNIFMPPPAGTVGIKHCAASTINEIGASEMQVGGNESTARKCHGDSGGPTYLQVTSGDFPGRRVVGITSHAYDMSDCAKGGLDTRVDVYVPWIDARMRAACADGTRSWCDEPGILPPGFAQMPPPRDGGPAPIDAGIVDAGVAPVAGGTNQRLDDEGCVCVGRTESTGTAWVLIVGFAVLLGRRRR